MKILAIETSCDETAAAVVEDGRRVLSSVVYSQIDEHRRYGGVVPEIASRRHVEQVVPVARAALDQAGTGLPALDAVAVTYAPGLIGALLAGVGFAKGLALSLGKPLIPVHHIRGHIAAGYLAYEDLQPPFLCLVVSGGHSHIVEVRDYTDFHVLGRTRDDAAGECFDKVARAMGLPYPGGVHLDRASRGGDPGRYPLPRPRVEGSPYDFSFSGLKTAAVNLLHNAAQKGETVAAADLAASLSHTVSEMLVSRFLEAARAYGHATLLCAGGVSANSTLRSLLESRAGEGGYRLFLPPLPLCGDNAAMIGAQAYYEYEAGCIAPHSLNAYASLPVDRPCPDL